MRLTIMVTALLMAGIGAAGVLVGSGLVGGGTWFDASPSLLWLGRFIFGSRDPDSQRAGIKGRKAFDRVTILLLFIVATYRSSPPACAGTLPAGT